MPVAEKTRSADGTPIAYERTGDGPPPLIIVGGAWNTRLSGTELAERLAGHFAVYTYDRRGRGDSGDTQPYAVEREIEDPQAIIEAAGGSAALFGHSSGGALALETTALGVTVSKLAVYEIPYIVDDSRPPLADDYIEHLEELVAAGRRREVVSYFMTEAVGMPSEMAERMANSPMAASMEPVAHTIAYDGRVMLRGSMNGGPLPSEWRDSVTVPTLVMDGGNSSEWLHSAARALVGLLPDVRYRTLEGQDHAAGPDAIAPQLEEFLG
ncbi:MAG TPA: alpha/beta hydrolase [Solirubrobacterales bacterium]|nr:alpha/beta hydrolase [Solirubrobacterales bacterium]